MLVGLWLLGLSTELDPEVEAENRFAITRLLIDHGARLDCVDELGRTGMTALHMAAQTPQVRMVRLLLSRGAELDPRDCEGRTPERLARNAAAGPMCDPQKRELYSAVVDLFAEVRPERQRAALLELRLELLARREQGHEIAPSSVAVHDRLFLEVPEDVFSHVLLFWRGAREDGI